MKDLARSLGVKTLFAIVLEHNFASQQLLERTGFSHWGFLPDVTDFDGTEVGQYYYGLRLNTAEQGTLNAAETFYNSTLWTIMFYELSALGLPNRPSMHCTGSSSLAHGSNRVLRRPAEFFDSLNNAP